jgi:ubiquinone/menaquinone biosynthesis C-methylase UbiE/uncharacterized protein YbaR (Trm112 family)
MRRSLRQLAAASETWLGTTEKIAGVTLLALGILIAVAGGENSSWRAVAIVFLVEGAVVLLVGVGSPVVVKSRRARRYEAQRARLTIMPPRSVDAGWLLRLRVENHGRPATFEGQITPVRQSPEEPDPSSWALPWRNHEGTPRARLDRGQAELLRLALARTARADPDLVLLSQDQHGQFAPRFPATPDRSVLVRVRIRDSERYDLVAEEVLSISFRRHDLAPTVVFVGETTQGTRPLAPDDAVAGTTTRTTDVPAQPRPTSPLVPREVVALDSSVPRAMPSRRLAQSDRDHLQDVLRCSSCGSRYDVGEEALVCNGCAASFPIVDGVPILLKDTTIGTKLDHIDVTQQQISEVGTVWKAIIERIGLQSPDAVEIGAGTGMLTLGLLREKAVSRLTATDVSPNFLRELRACAADDRALSLIACDANEQHFRSEAFDLVVGRLVLHHLLDYDVTLRNCRNMLKPGGAAVFFEPVLEGKTIVALLLALMLRCEEVTGGDAFSADERQKIRSLILHLLKSKLARSDREYLAQLEDKYIFGIDQMRATGKLAGFSDVEFSNNGEVRPAYWAYVAWTCLRLGIPARKVDRYRWIGVQFASTYGLMFPDRLVTPTGYFVFRR